MPVSEHIRRRLDHMEQLLRRTETEIFDPEEVMILALRGRGDLLRTYLAHCRRESIDWRRVKQAVEHLPDSEDRAWIKLRRRQQRHE